MDNNYQLNEDAEDLENWRKSGISMFYDNDGQLCLTRSRNQVTNASASEGKSVRMVIQTPNLNSDLNNDTTLNQITNASASGDNSDLKFVIIGLLILILIK